MKKNRFYIIIVTIIGILFVILFEILIRVKILMSLGIKVLMVFQIEVLIYLEQIKKPKVPLQIALNIYYIKKPRPIKKLETILLDFKI